MKVVYSKASEGVGAEVRREEVAEWWPPGIWHASGRGCQCLPTNSSPVGETLLLGFPRSLSTP